MRGWTRIQVQAGDWDSGVRVKDHTGTHTHMVFSDAGLTRAQVPARDQDFGVRVEDHYGTRVHLVFSNAEVDARTGSS